MLYLCSYSVICSVSSSIISTVTYYSLCAFNGDDDLFSSDLSDDQLRMRLGHMSSTHYQVIFSMGDENVPKYVDKKALVERSLIVYCGCFWSLLEEFEHHKKVQLYSTMEKSWIKASRISRTYRDGVQSFIDFAHHYPVKGETA
ncbi:hypothetical protein ACFE04_007349 [Oxalis oulophora]